MIGLEAATRLADGEYAAILRAAEVARHRLIAAANENAYIDLRRTALLLAARRWFFCALGLILLVAVLFGAYALTTPASTK